MINNKNKLSLEEKFFNLQLDICPDYLIEVGANSAEFSVQTSKNLESQPQLLKRAQKYILFIKI